jgi:hypothetical protein
MLGFYKYRLESTYIPDLRSSLKECDHLLKPISNAQYSEAMQQISILRGLAFDHQPSESILLDRHDNLVSQAYRLRKIREVKDLLLKPPRATVSTRKLWICICFLGRLRVCYEISKDIVNKLPSFAKVDIVLIPRAPVLQDSIKNALTLKQTLEKLCLQLDLPTIQTMLGEKWTIVKAEQKFRQLQRQKLNVHAEVQIIMFFSKLDETFVHLIRYFGCSKYSCFMCSHFLKAHGTFKTRGSHGRLFKPCTIPTTTGLVAIQYTRLRDAVLQVQKDIKKELKRDFQRPKKQEKTSVVGGSTVFSGESAKEAAANPVTESRRMKAEQERVAAMFKR